MSEKQVLRKIAELAVADWLASGRTIQRYPSGRAANALRWIISGT